MKAREVAQTLQLKGFKEERGRDHVYYFFWYDSKKTGISTKISHNERELSDQLCAFMAKQTKLTLSQFKTFIDCAMTEAMYIDHLIKSDQLKRPQQAAPASALVLLRTPKNKINLRSQIVRAARAAAKVLQQFLSSPAVISIYNPGQMDAPLGPHVGRGVLILGSFMLLLCGLAPCVWVLGCQRPF